MTMPATPAAASTPARIVSPRLARSLTFVQSRRISRRARLDTHRVDNDTAGVNAPLARVLLMGSLILTFCMAATPTHAQGVAAAEALFNEGRELLEAGETQAACEKFAESQRLDPSPGTALNLASCHERLGHVATAWGQYLVAKRLAKGQGRDAIAEEAARKVSELEPKLSYVKLNVQSPPDGLEVSIGNTVLADAALGSKLPVDPGGQTLSVSAPGHQAIELSIEVGEAGSVTEVVVPSLEPLEAEGEPAPMPTRSQVDAPDDSPPVTPAEQDHTLAYVLGGIGVAGLATGAVLGVMAVSANDEALDMCDGRTTNCPPGTVEKSEDAKAYSTAGFIVGGVGLVSLGVAAVLYFSSEPPTEAANAWNLPGGSQVSWRVDRDRTSVMLEGTF